MALFGLPFGTLPPEFPKKLDGFQSTQVGSKRKMNTPCKQVGNAFLIRIVYGSILEVESV
jgi:hypothetical protein